MYINIDVFFSFLFCNCKIKLIILSSSQQVWVMKIVDACCVLEYIWRSYKFPKWRVSYSFHVHPLPQTLPYTTPIKDVTFDIRPTHVYDTSCTGNWSWQGFECINIPSIGMWKAYIPTSLMWHIGEMRKWPYYRGVTYSIIWQTRLLCHNNKVPHENTH